MAFIGDDIIYNIEKIPPKPPEGIRFEFDRFLEKPHNYHGILLHQVGELCCNAGYEVPTHPQWCHEISYIVSGSAGFFCNDREYAVGPGDLFISPKGVHHRISAHPDTALRFAYMGFDFARDGPDGQYQELREFFRHIPQYRIHGMQKLMGPFYLLINEFFKPHPGGDLMIFSTMLQLLALVYQSAVAAPAKGYSGEVSEKAVGQSVYEVILYVTHHLFGMTSVQEMAQQLGYSEDYLSHVFREKTGQTIQSYVIQKKIGKSIELFRLGNCSVSSVAQQMGYASVHSFSKAFRRVTGYYPTQYIAAFCR